jgi:hypothetical protein
MSFSLGRGDAGFDESLLLLDFLIRLNILMPLGSVNNEKVAEV